MPPRVRFSREDVLNAAFEIVRESGMDALNARSVAARVGSSTQPLFRVFSGMDEIRSAVTDMAQSRFDEYIKAAQAGDMPVYKKTGLAYIRFAREEKQLYRLLFMRERQDETEETISRQTADYVRNAGMESTGLESADMDRFHMHMWVYVHGLATMISTGYMDVSDEMVSFLLTECYQGLRKQFDSLKK